MAPPPPDGVPRATPIPMEPNERLRMFARCPGLFIHAVATARGADRPPDPHAMFSPMFQLRAPRRYPVRRMRSTNVDPPGDVCEKKRLRAMAREWRRAAFESLRLKRSGRRSWRARSAFSTHRVARTRTRLLTWLAAAFAELHARPAAEAGGAATSSARAAAATATMGLGRTIHYMSRINGERALGVPSTPLDVCTTPFGGRLVG